MANKYLDQTGLLYFWSIIKNALNSKQDKLVAGSGITISQDGKTISSDYEQKISELENDIAGALPISGGTITGDLGIDGNETVIGNLTVGEKIIGKQLQPKADEVWSMPAVAIDQKFTSATFWEIARSKYSASDGSAYNSYLHVSGTIGTYNRKRYFELDVPRLSVSGYPPVLTIRGADNGVADAGFRVVEDANGIVHVGFNFPASTTFKAGCFDIQAVGFEPVLSETTVTGTEIAISVDKAQHDAVTQDFDRLSLTAKSWTTCATINVQPGKYLVTGGVTLQTAGGVLGVRLDYTEGSGSGEMRGTRAVGNASGTDLYASANATFVSSFSQAGSVKLMAYGYSGGTCYGRLRIVEIN